MSSFTARPSPAAASWRRYHPSVSSMSRCAIASGAFSAARWSTSRCFCGSPAASFDALVVGHEVKYLANIALMRFSFAPGASPCCSGVSARISISRRRDARGSAAGSGVPCASAQSRMLRLATDFLAYTSRGADHAMRSGMKRDRVTVLNNTIDISAEVAAHARAQSLDRAGFGGISASRPRLLSFCSWGG